MTFAEDDNDESSGGDAGNEDHANLNNYGPINENGPTMPSSLHHQMIGTL